MSDTQRSGLPKSIQEQLDKTAYLMQMGQDRRVLEILEEVLAQVKLDPDTAAIAWNDKGLAHKHLGDVQKALECYDRALEFKPDYAVAWLNKCKACLDLERWREAVRCGEEATRLEPANPLAWNNKGVAHRGLGELDDALACYERALELKPEYRAWENRKEVWNNKGDVHMAYLQRALDKGDMHMAQQQSDQARICFEKALEIDPEYAMAVANYGRTLFLQGERERALDHLQCALRIEPDDPMAQKWRQWLEIVEQGVPIQPPFDLDQVFDRVARETRDPRAREVVRELRRGVQHIHDYGLDRRRGATGLVNFAKLHRRHQPTMRALATVLCHMLDSDEDIEVECARNALVGFQTNLGFDTIGLINQIARKPGLGPQAYEQFQVIKDFIRQMRR